MALHYRSPATGRPTCGAPAHRQSTVDQDSVDCARCQRSPIYNAAVVAAARRRNEANALQQQAIQEAVQAVFEKARQIATDHGYCSTYQEIESEIIADLPYEIAPAIREYEVEVEIESTVYWSETVTVEASSAEEAARKVEDDPDSYIDSSLGYWSPSEGYCQSVEHTVTSTSDAG